MISFPFEENPHFKILMTSTRKEYSLWMQLFLTSFRQHNSCEARIRYLYCGRCRRWYRTRRQPEGFATWPLSCLLDVPSHSRYIVCHHYRRPSAIRLTSQRGFLSVIQDSLTNNVFGYLTSYWKWKNIILKLALLEYS